MSAPRLPLKMLTDEGLFVCVDYAASSVNDTLRLIADTAQPFAAFLTLVLLGMAEITERRRAFTESALLNTEATSGSKITATEPLAIRVANLLGRARR